MTHSQDQEPRERDRALVLRVGEGDVRAYRELVDRYAQRLLHFAMRLTRSTTEAEDVVQETFMRLWLHAGEYTPNARVTTWLHRIAHNLAVDRLRARGRFVDDDAIDDLAPASAPQPQLLEAKRQAEALHRALDGLPERQSSAIVLVHLHGLTGAEAAEVLGIQVEALESLLARGRRALKVALEGTLASAKGAPR